MPFPVVRCKICHGERSAAARCIERYLVCSHDRFIAESFSVLPDRSSFHFPRRRRHFTIEAIAHFFVERFSCRLSFLFRIHGRKCGNLSLLKSHHFLLIFRKHPVRLSSVCGTMLPCDPPVLFRFLPGSEEKPSGNESEAILP